MTQARKVIDIKEDRKTEVFVDHPLLKIYICDGELIIDFHGNISVFSGDLVLQSQNTLLLNFEDLYQRAKNIKLLSDEDIHFNPVGFESFKALISNLERKHDTGALTVMMRKEEAVKSQLLKMEKEIRRSKILRTLRKSSCNCRHGGHK